MITITGADIAAILPTLLWVTLALIALFLFKNNLQELLRVAVWRVKTGSQLKIVSFELGASYVPPQSDFSEKGRLYDVRVDEKDIRYQERRKYYEPNRFVFLVHKISPSKKPDQLYDILIYLIPHHGHNASLASVQKVEYYFGKSWGNRIFTSIDRANNFAISTSAYGPFTCTAEIYFSDGTTVMAWRYIDFEMGAIGREPLSPK
jgi:hypothetical protein